MDPDLSEREMRMKRWLIGISVFCSLCLQAEVKVSIESMTFDLVEADYAGRRSSGPGNYKVKGTEREITDTVDMIKINNGLIEAWVCPAYAGRLMRVTDLKTGVEYFHWEEVFEDFLAWQTGGMKPSFPFFEHGTFIRQPAGHRIVRNEDGSVTIAMDQRYTHHNTKADLQRYGRYSDEALNIMVTVYPDSTAVEWRQRKENLNPTPRSERCWNVVLFPQKRYTEAGFKSKKIKDPETGRKSYVKVPAQVSVPEKMVEDTQFVYPAPYVTDHGPTRVHTAPHWSHWDEGENKAKQNANWKVSHFSLFSPYGFGAVWYPKEHINRIRTHNPDRRKGPGLKLYSAYWPDFVEFWGGQGIVFESPDPSRPGFVPVDFTHHFWITQGMGLVQYANRHVAVSVEGNAFELMASRTAKAVVKDGTGKTVAEGPVGPYTILKGEFEESLVVTLDGEEVLNRNLPIEMPTPSRDLEYVLKQKNENKLPQQVLEDFQFIVEQRNSKRPGYWEEESFAHNEGMTRLADVMKVSSNVQGGDPAYLNSMARAVYRLGYLDEAERLAKLAPGPEADFTLGLITWERGGKVDFGKAGPASGYHRALLEIQNGNKEAAVKEVGKLLAETPTAWLPRLAQAYWAGDVEAANALARENPGSPEAQAVLRLLRQPNELDPLVLNNPSAEEHVMMFEKSLTKGTWSHMPRFPKEHL